jgi:hypothetical protein
MLMPFAHVQANLTTLADTGFPHSLIPKIPDGAGGSN